MNLKIKINIKSIIMYEQLTNKSYYTFDYSDNESILKLIFCIYLSNNELFMTLEQFKEILEKNKNISKEINDKINKEIQYINMFSDKKIEDKNEINEENNEKIKEIYVKDIATLLILNGVDPFFINDLRLSDLTLYAKALDKKIKTDLENNRLWTYLNICPHIDCQKIDSPAKLYPFDWDIKIKKDEHITMNIDELDKIFAEKQNLIKNN